MKMNKKLESWSGKCLASIRSAHRALSHLYDGLETDGSGSVLDSNGDAMIPIPEGWSLTQTALAFNGYCRDLMVMLSSPTEGRISLPLGAVMKLTTRCLRVTYADVASIPSMKELSELLPSLHQSALLILAHLILCCGTNLLPKGKDILDLCLQTLMSTEKMAEEAKSETRAHVYMVLSLWLEIAGLGRYYLSKIKDLNRELITDIAIEEKSVKQPANGSVSKEGGEPIGGPRKKNKGKKKGSRRAESYLDSAYADSTMGDAKPLTPQNVEATLGALKVAQLVAERGQFTPFQGLIRCVVETATTLERQPPYDQSPYADPQCRSSLYQTLLTWSSVPLDNLKSSADTVHHFQLTSKALSLIQHAAYNEQSIEVQRLCRNLISQSKTIGSVNRPIVRKVLPEEQVEMRDVMEMERQMEEMKEEKERLKKKVLELEMEAQRQTRLSTNLNEEIESLKAKVTKYKTSGSIEGQSGADAAQTTVDNESNEIATDDDDEDDEEEMEINAAKEKEAGTSKEMKDKDNLHEENEKKAKNEKVDASQPADQLQSSQKLDVKEQSQSLNVKDEEKGKKKKKKNKGKNRGAVAVGSSPGVSEKVDNKNAPSVSDKKRSLADSTEGISAEKKSKLETSVEDKSGDVHDMLMDFVDADPDSD